jgi:hypothetical protein
VAYFSFTGNIINERLRYSEPLFLEIDDAKRRLDELHDRGEFQILGLIYGRCPKIPCEMRKQL